MSFAVINHVRLDDPEVAAGATRDVVLPRLRQLPGYQQAVFCADDAGRTGFSVIVFETREQAAEMAERLGSGQVPNPPGITFERQEVWEVVATG